jgi:hypothetical protein
MGHNPFGDHDYNNDYHNYHSYNHYDDKYNSH